MSRYFGHLTRGREISEWLNVEGRKSRGLSSTRCTAQTKDITGHTIL